MVNAGVENPEIKMMRSRGREGGGGEGGGGEGGGRGRGDAVVSQSGLAVI